MTITEQVKVKREQDLLTEIKKRRCETWEVYATEHLYPVLSAWIDAKKVACDGTDTSFSYNYAKKVFAFRFRGAHFGVGFSIADVPKLILFAYNDGWQEGRFFSGAKRETAVEFALLKQELLLSYLESAWAYFDGRILLPQPAGWGYRTFWEGADLPTIHRAEETNEATSNRA